MSNILIKPAGQPIPRVEKRSSESISYYLDCTELLSANEVITSIQTPVQVPNIALSGLRTRKGVAIEVRVDSSPVLSAVYVDYLIEILFNTNLGNKKVAVFTVRIHK